MPRRISGLTLTRFQFRRDRVTILPAGRYTLLDRSARPLLRRAGSMGIAMVAAGVLNSGILATGARPDAKLDFAQAP